MAYCKECGTKMDDGARFCPNCGMDNAVQNGQPQQPAQPAASSTTSDAEQNKVMGILAYLSILVLVPIFAAKDSPFARFHANQGLTLFIFEVGISIITNILTSIFWNTWFISLLSWLCSLALLALSIIGIINASKGECKPLPVVGNITILK